MLSEEDIEVLSDTGLTDMAFIPEVEFHEVDAIVVLVTTIKQGCLSIRISIEVMKPFQTTRQVTPTDINHVL